MHSPYKMQDGNVGMENFIDSFSNNYFRQFRFHL